MRLIESSDWADGRSSSSVTVTQSGPGEPAVVVAAGEFDVGDRRVDEALETGLAAGGGRVVVDLAAVTFIDSSVVRALLLSLNRAVSAGGWLRLVWTSSLVSDVLDLCGTRELFPQFATVAAATAGDTDQ